MPPALSDDEASDVEAPPFPPLSSRNSLSAAGDADDADYAAEAGDGDAVDDEMVDKPSYAHKNITASNDSEDDDDDGEDAEDMEEDEFIVEAIKNHMIDEDGTLKFQVKWEGYESKKDLTWEPEENLEESAQQILDDYFDSIGGREKIFEQTQKAARGKKRGKRGSNAGGNSTKRTRKNGTHPADSEPPASAPKPWAPPAGSWEEEIDTIDACEDPGNGRLLVYLIWKNGKKTKHETPIIYKKCPQKMLQFYEKHVKIITEDGK